MTITIFAVVFGIFLAYANGANDNFKGVGTLYGSGVASYRGALMWSTLATAAGSVTAIIVAKSLLLTFSGKGLVPDHIVALKSFSLSVGFAAAITVMLATQFGLPISTTHALTGALIGAGFLGSNFELNLNKLKSVFFLPLVISPFLAMICSALVYVVFKATRKACGITKATCICVGQEAVNASLVRNTITIDTQPACQEKYQGHILGIKLDSIANGIHYLTGIVVCFARALNDTPKIAATLLIANTVSPTLAVLFVAIAMALGGIIHSNKIAETIGHKVTTMNAGQGLSANLVTGILVIFATKLGLPVSTTHVSVGSIFGIGTISRQANWKVIFGILLAWVTTLPIAAVLAAALFFSSSFF